MDRQKGPLAVLLLLLLLERQQGALGFEEDDVDHLFDRNVTRQNIPMLFKRLYREWSGSSECTDHSLRSSEASVRPRGEHRASVRVRVPRNLKQCTRVEMRVEFHGPPGPDPPPRPDLQPADPRLSRTPRACSAPLQGEGHSEVAFDVTDLIAAAVHLKKRHVNLRLRWRGYKVGELRAFLVVYRSSELCSFGDLLMLQKRSAIGPEDLQKPCVREDWYITFENIGWDHWVIAPHGVMAYRCSGSCNPLGMQAEMSGHAHLQVAAHYASGGSTAPACCVPRLLDPLTMVTFDSLEEAVHITQYPNMVARTCGCL